MNLQTVLRKKLWFNENVVNNRIQLFSLSTLVFILREVHANNNNYSFIKNIRKNKNTSIIKTGNRNVFNDNG